VAPVSAPFRFDRIWTFPVPPAELWAVLCRTDDYVSWWSWLREFEADGLRAGTRARCTIQSPLPYALHCDIRVLAIEPEAAIVTQIGGDLRGPARLDIAPAAAGSTARLSWSLELGNPVLGRLARFGRPVMSWAHDVVVAIGVDQFRRRALAPGTGDALAS
jgi:uncharacterized protein YndB with AHSA1/START domain